MVNPLWRRIEGINQVVLPSLIFNTKSARVVVKIQTGKGFLIQYIMTLQVQYTAQGFCFLPDRTIDQKFLKTAQEGLLAVRDETFDTGVPPSSHPGYDPGKLCKINNAHLANHALYAMLVESTLGERIAEVTVSKMVQVWASQLLIKPPGSEKAGRVGWHQDRQYWQYWQRDEGLFTAWIALDDVKEESGPMQLVPGSHCWGFLGQGDFFNSDQETLRASIEIPAGERWEEVSALLPAGGVSLHHSLTFHGSQENISNRARCSLAVHLRDERAEPVLGNKNYYVSHLGDMQYNPVIFQG